MSVDKATVRTITQLARIQMPEDELDTIAGEFANIVGWVEQLSEADTENVEPLDVVTEGHSLPWRDDTVTDGNRREDIVANAPESEDGMFLVPKVVE